MDTTSLTSPQKLASNLYQRTISDLPHVILSLETGTQFLSNLASQTGLEDNVFPPDFVDEFDDADQIMFCEDEDESFSFGGTSSMSWRSSGSHHEVYVRSESHNSTIVHNNSQQYLHGFKHDMQNFITQVISLENSMINILEDLMLYAESRWQIAPALKTAEKGIALQFDFHETDSQNSLDSMGASQGQTTSASKRTAPPLTREASTTSLYYNSEEFSAQKSRFYQLLHEFEAQTEMRDIYASGVKIHAFLGLNEHLDKVQCFYEMVRGLRDANEDYTRSHGFDLSKERASALLEDGEKLEVFYDRVVDKVAQYQNVMRGLNVLLGLAH